MTIRFLTLFAVALLNAYPQTTQSGPSPYTYSHPGQTSGQNPHGHTKPDPPVVQPRSGGSSDVGSSLAAAGGGFLAGMLTGQLIHGSSDPAKLLSDHGPQTTDLFSMSVFSVVGFVKGNWPMALDYELREPGIYLLTVSVEGFPPFDYLLDGTKAGHFQQILTLPARFGPDTRPATCTLRALSSTPGEIRPLYFRVFGWACGNRAVGSIAIDQVRFTPAEVRPREKQMAVFGFHSHADFEKVTAEFERVALIDGNIVAKVEDRQKIDDPVRINTEISDKRWDPKKASVGQHLLQIRAWYSLNHGGDWVIAWSPQIVRVEE